MDPIRHRLGTLRTALLVAALAAAGAPALAAGYAPSLLDLLGTAAAGLALEDSGGADDPSGPWPYL